MCMGLRHAALFLLLRPVLETLPSSTDYYVPANRDYNGSLLANCAISLAGPAMVACYLVELRLPTVESHRPGTKRTSWFVWLVCGNMRSFIV